MTKDVLANWQYKCNNIMPHFNLKTISISKKSKHESCRVVSYGSIEV